MISDDVLKRITAELFAREPIFHRLEFGCTREDFARLMDDNFWEVGASGKKYNRDFILDTLEARDHSIPESFCVTDFLCTAISADSFLATYQLEQESQRLSRRATLWKLYGSHWKILYHQGTLIQNEEDV